MRTTWLGVVALLALLAGACGDGGSEPATAGDQRLRVVASFYPLAEVSRAVGGEHVVVENLTPPGAEPHDVELTTDQADDVEDAAVVLYVGGGFQPAVEELAERRDDGAVDLLAVTEADGDHATASGDDGQGREGDADPHFWLDPTMLARATHEVAEALAHADEPNAEAYEANAQRYEEQLAQLDAEFEEGLADCDRRDLVTAHAAFGHLARRYDLTQLPVTGINPEAEPDPRRLAELADVIAERGVTTVFTETLVSPAVAETLARETGATTAVLDPLEGLTDERATRGADYLSVMRENLAALRTGLGCR